MSINSSNYKHGKNKIPNILTTITDKYIGAKFCSEGISFDTGFDCGTLAIAIIDDLFGVKIPYSSKLPISIEDPTPIFIYSYTQASTNVLDKLPKDTKLKLGDLIVFDIPITGWPLHAAVYLLQGKIIHMTYTGAVISELAARRHLIYAVYRVKNDKRTYNK